MPLSTVAVAQKFQVRRDWILKQCLTGKIRATRKPRGDPSVRGNGRWFIDESELPTVRTLVHHAFPNRAPLSEKKSVAPFLGGATGTWDDKAIIQAIIALSAEFAKTTVLAILGSTRSPQNNLARRVAVCTMVRMGYGVGVVQRAVHKTDNTVTEYLRSEQDTVDEISRDRIRNGMAYVTSSFESWRARTDAHYLPDMIEKQLLTLHPAPSNQNIRDLQYFMQYIHDGTRPPLTDPLQPARGLVLVQSRPDICIIMRNICINIQRPLALAKLDYMAKRK